MQLVLMMPDIGFSLMNNINVTVQNFNLKNHVCPILYLKMEPFFKLQISTLQSRSKSLDFVFRQRKLFNEGGELLLIK